jgi:hypothetical protein
MLHVFPFPSVTDVIITRHRQNIYLPVYARRWRRAVVGRRPTVGQLVTLVVSVVLVVVETVVMVAVLIDGGGGGGVCGGGVTASEMDPQA